MAIMAPKFDVVKRSDGNSSVAFAAYRASALLYDHRTGERHDYSRKRGVIHSEIIAPAHSPNWVYDRQRLWNEIEAAGRQWNTQVAREFMLPLPYELSEKDRLQLVRDFVNEHLVSRGMIADINIHLPHRNGDQRNHHVHILCTMRHINKDGFGNQAAEWNDIPKVKQRLSDLRNAGKHKEADELDAKRNVNIWRKAWADKINEHLKKHGFVHRVDHRSWKDQGIDRIPENHMGHKATALERKGVRTRAGDERRRIQQLNAQIEQEQKRLYNIDQVHIANQRAALDNVRKALKELKNFDDGHHKINHISEEISVAFSGIRRIENRIKYAKDLHYQVYKNFKKTYVKNPALAVQKYRRDVKLYGINRANKFLLDYPRRYGKLARWQVGKRFYTSKDRKFAKDLLVPTAEISRQAFNMSRKIKRQKEHKDLIELKKRLAIFKDRQKHIMTNPPEGRLIIQRAIYETARGLSTHAWSDLSKQERYHITQARILMNHSVIRKWADKRALEIFKANLDIAPPKEFILSQLVRPIDFINLSPFFEQQQLKNSHAEMLARHKQDRESLSSALKEAKTNLSVNLDKLTKTGFTGLLARSTGLDHVIKRLFAEQQKKLEQSFVAMKRLIVSRQQKEIKVHNEAKKDLKKRIRQSIKEAEDKILELEERKLQLERLRKAKAHTPIPSLNLEELKRRHLEWRNKTGWKPEKLQKPSGDYKSSLKEYEKIRREDEKTKADKKLEEQERKKQEERLKNPTDESKARGNIKGLDSDQVEDRIKKARPKTTKPRKPSGNFKDAIEEFEKLKREEDKAKADKELEEQERKQQEERLKNPTDKSKAMGDIKGRDADEFIKRLEKEAKKRKEERLNKSKGMSQNKGPGYKLTRKKPKPPSNDNDDDDNVF